MLLIRDEAFTLGMVGRGKTAYLNLEAIEDAYYKYDRKGPTFVTQGITEVIEFAHLHGEESAPLKGSMEESP